MKKVIIYTDGACSGNPGRGGWGAILMYGDKIKKISGSSEEETTNNKMELTAVIEALSIIKEPVEIELFTDSKYVLEGATIWSSKWISNNWKIGKNVVKNKELWEKLLSLASVHKINWHWVKGHHIDKYNIEVDKLARSMIT